MQNQQPQQQQQQQQHVLLEGSARVPVIPEDEFKLLQERFEDYFDDLLFFQDRFLPILCSPVILMKNVLTKCYIQNFCASLLAFSSNVKFKMAIIYPFKIQNILNVLAKS